MSKARKSHQPKMSKAFFDKNPNLWGNMCSHVREKNKKWVEESKKAHPEVLHRELDGASVAPSLQCHHRRPQALLAHLVDTEWCKYRAVNKP